MTQQTSPYLDIKYGWSYGESGWNSGMDENLLKFSFMFDGNLDSIVSSLPSVSNGKAYFLSTDNKIYFGVGGTYYFITTPKWFNLKIQSTGEQYLFDGTSLVLQPNLSSVNTRLTAVEASFAGLGTASTKNIADFSSPAQTTAAVNILRNDLLSSTGTDRVYKGAQTLTTVLDNKAAKGVNSDITQLLGLTVPLSPAQGGSGGIDVPTLAGTVSTNSTNIAALQAAQPLPANIIVASGSFNSTATPSLLNANNVTSITRTGAGDFVLTLSRNLKVGWKCICNSAGVSGSTWYNAMQVNPLQAGTAGNTVSLKGLQSTGTATLLDSPNGIAQFIIIGEWA